MARITNVFLFLLGRLKVQKLVGKLFHSTVSCSAICIYHLSCTRKPFPEEEVCHIGPPA